jgi:hypothetical protein
VASAAAAEAASTLSDVAPVAGRLSVEVVKPAREVRGFWQLHNDRTLAEKKPVSTFVLATSAEVPVCAMSFKLRVHAAVLSHVVNNPLHILPLSTRLCSIRWTLV